MNKDKPVWAGELIDVVKSLDTRIGNLEEQTHANCGKLDTLQCTMKEMKEDTDLLPKMYEMLEAAGENNETRSKEIDGLDKRVGELENKPN